MDGNNVLEVYEAARRAADMCRQGKGPVFMECKTYRLRGHVGPDDNIQGTHTDIRPPEEVIEWQRKDPVEIFGERLMEDNVVSSAELVQINAQVDLEIKQAFELADAGEYPREEEVMAYVFK